jgi:hypothetical protein
MRTGDSVMNPEVIYQDKSEPYHYHSDSAGGHFAGGPRKLIAYIGGVIYVLDHDQGQRLPFPLRA